MDLVFLDLESLAGMAGPVSRMDLESPGQGLMAEWRDLKILGPGLPVVCLLSVAVWKAWPENRPRVGARKAWL